MGAFDTVLARCPACGGDMEFQSKAGLCVYNEYVMAWPDPRFLPPPTPYTVKTDLCVHLRAPADCPICVNVLRGSDEP